MAFRLKIRLCNKIDLTKLNLYGDLAMWDSYAFGHYSLFCRELLDILDYAGVSKVVFGSGNDSRWKRRRHFKFE